MAKRTAKIFLGGTCKGVDWRAEVMPKMMNGYFNPHITDREWQESDREEELLQRRYDCTHMCYVITSGTVGFYSVAEATEDVVLRPHITYVCFYEDPENPWTEEQKASVAATKAMYAQYTNKVYDDLEDLVDALNQVH